jgi:hypothetical protein
MRVLYQKAADNFIEGRTDYAVRVKPGDRVPVSFVARGEKSFSNVFGVGIKTVFVDTFPL